MIFLIGQRSARVGHYTDTDQLCYRCRASDREVSVYQRYFHLTFIPCFPIGPKTFHMRCRSCGDETTLESVVRAAEGKYRTPFYLYTGPALVLLIVVAWFFWHSNVKKETAHFVADPAIGDVYTLEEESPEGTKYTFLRVAAVGKDTILMLENHLEYTGFVSDLADDDYFESSDTLPYTRRKLERMREDKAIARVERDFSPTAGFNRIR